MRFVPIAQSESTTEINGVAGIGFVDAVRRPASNMAGSGSLPNALERGRTHSNAVVAVAIGHQRSANDVAQRGKDLLSNGIRDEGKGGRGPPKGEIRSAGTGPSAAPVCLDTDPGAMRARSNGCHLSVPGQSVAGFAIID